MKKKYIRKVIQFLGISYLSSVSIANGQECDTCRSRILYAAAWDYIKNDSIGKQYNIIPSINLIPTSYRGMMERLSHTDIDSLKIVTDIDIAYVSPASRNDFNEKTIEWLAWSHKIGRFDRRSLEGKSDTLSYNFQPNFDVPVKVEAPIEDLLSHDPLPPFYMDPPEILTLHFSPIFGNELFAELSYVRGRFGYGFTYYFKFDSEGSIKYVDFWRFYIN